MPRVAIVLPTYNRGYCVMDAIEGAMTQTVADWEMAVVDDGSSDDTRSRLATVSDPRITVIHLDRNVGEGAARNAGIRATTAPLIATLDSDDIWLPDHLERTVAFLDARPDIGVVGTQIQAQTPLGQPAGAAMTPTDPDVIARHLLLRCPMHHPTTVMRRTALELVGLYASNRHGVFDDVDLWLRMRSRGVRMANLPHTTAIYRLTSDGLTRGNARPERIACNIAAFARGLAQALGRQAPDEGCQSLVALMCHAPHAAAPDIKWARLIGTARAVEQMFPDDPLLGNIRSKLLMSVAVRWSQPLRPVWRMLPGPIRQRILRAT